MGSLRTPRFGDMAVSGELVELMGRSDHRALALWAADCAERVLPLFETRFPKDERPRRAIEDLREFARTGRFSMAAVRKASLGAHAAAREAEEGSPARFAARAAGQAVATAHVPTHAPGAALYASKAIWASDPRNAETNVAREREWQHRRLAELMGTAEPSDKEGKVRLLRN